MNQDIFYLKELVNKENEFAIYKHRVYGIPFWRIVRFIIRTRFLNLKTGFQYNTTKKKVDFKSLIINLLISFTQYSRLFFKRCQFDNIVFAFPRLQKIGDKHIDKFTDPIISNSNINKSCIIFQRPLAGNHKKNRVNSEIMVKTDFVEVFSKLIGILTLPVIVVVYFRTVTKVYNSSSKYFLLKQKHILFFFVSLSNFTWAYFFHYILFKKLKPKRIFIVDREIFFPVILASKRLGIKVYEIQHGVTHGETAVYSGYYDKSIDPDFFLAFGEAWIGPQFGMPLERIINIGWAYKDYIKGQYHNISVTENSILVISEPHITSKIISITKDLALLHNNITFHIRLHPQESLSEKHKNMLIGVNNIFIQDNTVESTLAIMSYNYLIGENSSVLYEALSFGKKVGRINYGGLVPELVEGNVVDGFYYLNSPDDFNLFTQSTLVELINNNSAYSDFDQNKFNSLT